MPRLRLSLLIPILAAIVGGSASLAAADAKPPATTPAVEAQTVSPAVSAGLKKWTVRADAARSSGMSPAARADLLTRLAALDESIESGGDIAALLGQAKTYGLVAADADWAQVLAALKGGAAPVAAAPVAPAPATAPAAPAVTPPATVAAPAPAQAETTMGVGAKARLFAFPAGAEWPPKAGLPEVPLATLRVPGIPDVAPKWVQRPGLGEVPNRLLESPALDQAQAQFYAIEWTGYYYATESGPVALTVESDDPVVVEWNGKAIGKSDWSLPIKEWAHTTNNAVNTIKDIGQRTAILTAGTPSMTTGRYYAVRVLAYQRWLRTAKTDPTAPWLRGWREGAADGDVDGRALEAVVCGAALKVRIVRPDQSMPETLTLHTQQPKRVLRDE